MNIRDMKNQKIFYHVVEIQILDELRKELSSKVETVKILWNGFGSKILFQKIIVIKASFIAHNLLFTAYC